MDDPLQEDKRIEREYEQEEEIFLDKNQVLEEKHFIYK